MANSMRTLLSQKPSTDVVMGKSGRADAEDPQPDGPEAGSADRSLIAFSEANGWPVPSPVSVAHVAMPERAK